MSNNAATERRRFEEEENLIREDVQRMKEDLAALRADFRSLAGDTISAGRSKAAAAAHTTAEHGREAIEEFESHVREHPLASLALAFAGGALAGLVFANRR